MSGTNGNGAYHNEKGKFKKGNPGGPGNPLAQKIAKFRAVIVNAVTEEDLLEVWKTLLAKAKAGESWAVKELHDRLLGRAKAVLEVQKGEAVEAGDPFDLLKDEEVTGALDRALARRTASRPLAEPGCSSN